MKLSLLYIGDASEDKTADALAENRAGAVYNLSIDRAVSVICPELNKCKRFLSVLASPCADKSDVLYRRNILRDFQRLPGLFEEVSGIFTKIESIRAEWDFQRRRLYSLKRTNVAETSLDDYRALLSITSSYAKKVMAQIEKAAKISSERDLTPNGLDRICAYCSEMTSSDAFSDIGEIMNDCSELSSQCIFDMSVRLDDSLRVLNASLCGIKHVEANATPQKPVSRGLFRSKIIPPPSVDKKKLPDAPDIKVFDITVFDKSVLTSSLRDLENLLTRVLRGMCDIFAGIPRDIIFYEVSLAYLSQLRFKGVPYSWPEIKDADEPTFVCESLYDYYLVSTSPSLNTVVPNSVAIDGGRNGILVRGKNNSGKTVFLRSIGTAQIFAQAGLPVCAEKSAISLRTSIFTHFASGERVSAAGDASGHFEDEVKDVAVIIDSLTPNSLVMFNESFQSTAYDEGAAGMFDILRYIAATGSMFIAVSHLTKLFELYTDENGSHPGAVFMRTLDGYKVKTES